MATFLFKWAVSLIGKTPALQAGVPGSIPDVSTIMVK